MAKFIEYCRIVKFVFSKKATKIDEIFTVHLILCSKCQIDGEDFENFCGLFRKHKLYETIETRAFLPLNISAVGGVNLVLIIVSNELSEQCLDS